MAASLTRVISEMKDACSIPPELIVEMERHMRHLMEGVRSIADATSRPGAHTATAPQPAPRAASTVPQPVRAKRSRIVGKHRTVSLLGLRTKIVGKSKPRAHRAGHMDLDDAPTTARGNARATVSAEPGQPCL